MTQRVEYELVRSQIDSGLGNYASALRHTWSNRRLSDSLYAVDKEKQVQELEIKYETEKKDKDLDLQAGNIQLLKKQNQLCPCLLVFALCSTLLTPEEGSRSLAWDRT